MKSKKLTLLTILLLVASDFIEAQIMFSFKMVSMIIPPEATAILSPSVVGPLLRDVIHSPFLWLGLLGMISSFVIWSAILSNIDLSVAYPLGSLSFVLIPVISVLFLDEQISALRWLGIGFITFGIVMLSFDGRTKRGVA